MRFTCRKNPETGEVETIELPSRDREHAGVAIHDRDLPEALHSESVERWHQDAPRHDEIGRAVFLNNREKAEFCARNPDYREAKDHAGASLDAGRAERARRKANQLGRHANAQKGNFFLGTRE